MPLKRWLYSQKEERAAWAALGRVGTQREQEVWARAFIVVSAGGVSKAEYEGLGLANLSSFRRL